MEAIRTDGDTDGGAAHLETRGAEQISARDEGNEALAGDGKVKEAQGRRCRLLFSRRGRVRKSVAMALVSVCEKRGSCGERAGGREPQSLTEIS